MFWLWLGCKRLEKPPPTSLKHFFSCTFNKRSSKSAYLWISPHILQWYHTVFSENLWHQPAVVFLVNDSIPTSGICNNWSEMKRVLALNYPWVMNQVNPTRYKKVTLAKGTSTCSLQCWSRAVSALAEPHSLPGFECQKTILSQHTI